MSAKIAISAEVGERPRAGFARAWTLAFVLGEMVGFVPPALTGGVLAVIDAPDLAMIGGLTLAGMVEGAAIGIAQARVLARFAPQVDGRAWAAATVIAAGIAWFVGMAASALGQTDLLPVPVLVVVVAPTTALALLSMGYLQWRVLRRTVFRCGRWVWVTTGAWLIGVMIPVVALSVVPNHWPIAAHVCIGIIAAVAMGLTVGLMTGRTLERLVSERTRPRIPGNVTH